MPVIPVLPVEHLTEIVWQIPHRVAVRVRLCDPQLLSRSLELPGGDRGIEKLGIRHHLFRWTRLLRCPEVSAQPFGCPVALRLLRLILALVVLSADQVAGADVALAAKVEEPGFG